MWEGRYEGELSTLRARISLKSMLKDPSQPLKLIVDRALKDQAWEDHTVNSVVVSEAKKKEHWKNIVFCPFIKCKNKMIKMY